MLYYNPNEPQYPQTLDWSCSACSLAWLNRALAIDMATDEASAIAYIGTPQNINSTYGLMDASGSRLAQCLTEQGAAAATIWPTWSQVIRLATVAPLLLGGIAWNHWVGVRGFDGDQLLLANSAEGWQGIYGTLSASSYTNLGPMAAVLVPLQRPFPPGLT